jgi:pre-mRNA-splicing factor SYF1
VNFIASQAIARSQQKAEEGNQDANGREGVEKEDAMAAIELQARAPMGFVAATTGPEGGNRPPPQEAQPVAANPDAIDIDASDDDD